MRRIGLNKGWNFSEGTATTLDMLFRATAGAPELKSYIVDLPHDAVIETPRKNFYAGASTGFWESKDIYYTKQIFFEKTDAKKCFWLEFEGVFQLAVIFVNGIYAGRCMYGYGNYYINITEYLHFGEENEIKVVVKNGITSSRWYSGGGIYRNVNLLVGNTVHVACEGTRITAAESEGCYALLELVTPVEYAGSFRSDLRIKNEIIDAEGVVVAEEETPLTMTKAGKVDVRQKINLSDVTTWDLEKPYLYTCRTSIRDSGKVVDDAETSFGIRKLQMDAVHGLRLNGKEIKLKGGCIHHDNGVVGAATFAESEERRIRKLKAAGFNAVRSGHGPMSRQMLDACDRLGMLVYDEFSDVWANGKIVYDYALFFEDCWERDLTNMVLRDYNHPCVVLYSIGNEIPEIPQIDGYAWARQLSEKVRSLDPTRFIALSMNPVICMIDEVMKLKAEHREVQESENCETGEINSTLNSLGDELEFLWEMPKTSQMTEETCAQVDVVGYNYATGLYERDHDRYPNRVMFGSETYPKYLAGNWEIIKKHPYIIGDFCWTACDYLGEAGIGDIDHNDAPKPESQFYGSWPWRSACSGVLDLIGDENPIGYWRELIWGSRTAPYIAVRPPEYYGRPMHTGNWTWISDSINSWTWPGYEGCPVKVEIYTKAEEVKLFLDGELIGTAKTGVEYPYVAVIDTVYRPGELRAVAGGEEYILCTAVDDNCLVACLDEEELKNRNREITNIELSICDKNGVLNRSSTKKIAVKVEGDGKVQGFGTADPLSTENFYDSIISVFRGRALAVIRHMVSGGTINVTFTADGCEPVVVRL